MSQSRTIFYAAWLRIALLCVMPGILLSACSGGPSNTTSSGPIEITYQYPAFNTSKDVQAVQDAMNNLLKQKINATIKLQPIDVGSYDQKMKLLFASGQSCDIVFTAPWINNYYQNVTQGNLIPLDDLLKQDAPKTLASLSPAIWNAARVNGKIYGVINQQTFIRRVGVGVRKDLAEKYHLDLNSINSFQDLTPFLQQIKQNEPGVTPISSSAEDGNESGYLYYSNYLNMDIVDGLSTDHGLLVIRANDSGRKVVNAATQPEFKQLVDLTRQWYQAGYYLKDPLPTADLDAAWRSGKFAVEVGVMNADSAGQLQNRFGQAFVTKAFGTPILTTGGTVATMNGICRTSAHPDVAMKILELLNTDQQVYRLITHGIEGKHYVVVDKDKGVIGFPPGVDASTDGYNPDTPWMFGNLFNSYYNLPSIVGAWDTMKQINASATPSVALGFAFNPEKVKTQIAQITSVVKQYGIPIYRGQVDATTALPIYLQKLKDAGIDDVIAELQTQVDAWAKTQK
ncbi:MAG TPA: ABC transporter substrate-binding protein [Ktedonosporobacter sp.]|nr:ABC transporter substrate-binding protein [Ktedonosporobacter sp.]